MDETKLANHKLKLATTLFESRAWTQNEKVNILSAFDKTETAKEADLVYESYKVKVKQPVI